jgi:hypothetical protein
MEKRDGNNERDEMGEISEKDGKSPTDHASDRIDPDPAFIFSEFRRFRCHHLPA